MDGRWLAPTRRQRSHQGIERVGGGLVHGGGGIAATTHATRVDEIALAVVKRGARVVEGVARVAGGGSMVRYARHAVFGRTAAAASSTGVGEVDGVEAARVMICWE